MTSRPLLLNRDGTHDSALSWVWEAIERVGTTMR